MCCRGHPRATPLVPTDVPSPQVTHTVHMSTLGPSSYHFNATFVGDRQLSPTEVRWPGDTGWPRGGCKATRTGKSCPGVRGSRGMGCPQLTPLCPQAFPTLVGDMDNSGSLNAQVLQLVAERIRTKAVFQVGPGGRGPRVGGVSPPGR